MAASGAERVEQARATAAVNADTPVPPPNSWSTGLWAVIGRMYVPRKSAGFHGHTPTIEKSPPGVGVAGAPITIRKRRTISPAR